MKWLGLLVAVVVSTPRIASAADPCRDVTGFAGDVIVGSFAPGAVELAWTAEQEGSVREYRLSRRATGCDRASCLRPVATIRPRGVATGPKTYRIVNTAPPGVWVYRLEVKYRHDPSCAVDTSEVLVGAPPPCDLAALCAQVGYSFAGDVIVGSAVSPTVTLKWATHAESAAGGYRLSRSNCAHPQDCTTEIATVDATGSCGVVQVHSVSDTPPAGTWTYQLEVLDSGGRTSCAMRLPAPAPPASSR